MFQFDCKDDMDSVLHDEPLIVGDRPLILKIQAPEFNFQ